MTKKNDYSIVKRGNEKYQVCKKGNVCTAKAFETKKDAQDYIEYLKSKK